MRLSGTTASSGGLSAQAQARPVRRPPKTSSNIVRFQMIDDFRNTAAIIGILGALGLTLSGGTAQAQTTDDLDASATTNAAAGIACGQNLSFGRIYIGASNPLATVTLSVGATLNSNEASVAVTGGAVGLCTISGLQGGDTATITIAGGGGTPASGGLTGITLSDGASHTLTASILIGGGGTAVSGGRSGLANGLIPFFGSVTIPAAHLDFGTYTTTLTATAALN